MRILSVLTVLFCGLAAWPAQAAMLQVNPSGVLTGALGVNVEGSLFDVRFVDGTCVSAFDGCNSLSDFDETSSSQALKLGQAMRDQVFVDDPLGDFDTDPSKTLGCESTSFGFCRAYIPYGIQAGVLRSAITVKNNVGVGGTQVSGGTIGSGFGGDSVTFARVSPSVVPAPPAAAALLTAIGVFAWASRRRASARAEG